MLYHFKIKSHENCSYFWRIWLHWAAYYTNILAKIFLIFIEKIPINLLTMEKLLLFKNDNLPSNIDKNFDDLDIEPRKIRQIIKIYIKKNT